MVRGLSLQQGDREHSGERISGARGFHNGDFDRSDVHRLPIRPQHASAILQLDRGEAVQVHARAA